MEMAIKVMGLLPWTDWAALAAFFVGWIGYAVFARRRSTMQPSLLDITNQIRRQWMLQSTYREVRVVDGIVIQSLSTSPSFFASTTILIIGGLLAVLGTTEKASELVREIPFAARTSVLVFDMKIVLLVGIFVYAFFRFTWSLRQYTFGALLVGSLPESDDLAAMGDAGRCGSPGLRRTCRPRRRAGRRDLQRRAARLLLRLRGDRLVLLAAGLRGRDGGRGLDPLPARVPLRGAGRAEGLTLRRRAPGAGR